MNRANDELRQLDLSIRDLRAEVDNLRPQLEELRAEIHEIRDFVKKNSERQRHRIEYNELKPRIRQIVRDSISETATVLVVSKGDDELLDLDGRASWHFPQVEDGSYAGHYPASNEDAIAHLKALLTRGAEFLLFPKTAFWWFDHYGEFRRYLDSHYTQIVGGEDCVIYDLTEHARTESCQSETRWTEDAIERLRPIVCTIDRPKQPNGSPRRVLVLGIYLAGQQNTCRHVISTLTESSLCNVTQRWVALGGTPPANVRDATVKTIVELTPKFQIINDLLSQEKLSEYDYVLLCDDDIVLSHDFLDYFIPLQERLNFSLAQPARTCNSFIDHPIVAQQQGILARQTLFVEIGPVVSFHKSVYDLLFPFDLTSPMGWGYENVWSCLLNERNMKLGIIDAIPVDHSLRRPVSNYSWAEADRGKKKYLRKQQHYTTAECMRVLKVFEIDSATPRSARALFKTGRALSPWTNRFREEP
ncbi:MAG TPA: hypothetical protein VLK65_27245 [Vicinamibacteria bacterium]|nr:hypothetical protein [Vicinamibacteria bacterium]